MLRFFRTLRRKLLEEDNIRKYIWYALGEILLVMIGILLALQVNNWNEERKKKEIAEQYYLSFLESSKADLVKLQDYKAYSNEKLEAVLTLRKEMAVASSYEEIFESAVTFHFPSTSLFIDESLWQAVVNSGEISLFENELKEAMLSYWGNYEKFVRKEITNQGYYFEGIQYMGSHFPNAELLSASQGNEFLFPLLLEKALTLEAAMALDGTLSWLEAKNKESSEGIEGLITQLDQIIVMLENELEE